MIWSDLLRQAAQTLTAAGIEGAPRDARRLAAHVLGIDASRITLIAQDPVAPGLAQLYTQIIDQRARRVPVSHLTGTRQFYGRTFEVTPDVLDPRPETEILIQAALARPWQRLLDLGTGSGCILLTLLAERGPTAFGIGTDLSRAALAVAMRNAAALRLGDHVQFHAGSWLDALPASTAAFDLIVSNPPYITLDEYAVLDPGVSLYEPRLALTDEGDGLAAYRQITSKAPAHLVQGGWLIVEIGPTQGPAVADMFTRIGFETITVTPDFDGRDRVVAGQKPRSALL
ncbi:peptide chain release factor N(5)-glutamine methyltransferase [Loktanella salsilacus]|uniref:peptide chain release factor N(5)-glutamine methyltransferase n=1 Tax=Loktanella salsilacus TaxID=195913 RepID=UPI0020B6DD76|nr:peptide chain release factor N(5)-glutamine methyltransferase [Loktanella salsilacus]UTH49617.1 peptide chain release factor N(5)-glutamine methyltransferase [Loktanella salsilacus]